jgi:hypothetical protein
MSRSLWLLTLTGWALAGLCAWGWQDAEREDARCRRANARAAELLANAEAAVLSTAGVLAAGERVGMLSTNAECVRAQSAHRMCVARAR